MWSYYGAKTNIVNCYPPPKHERIIEPFAGSARYALKYFDREVILVDKYEVIVKIWRWLQQCSVEDIKKLPRMKEGQRLDDFNFDCDEAKNLCGFLIGFANTEPRKVTTSKLTQRPNFMNFRLNQIADSLHKIKHWDIRLGSFEEIPNQIATWFVDPPYNSVAGKLYVHNSSAIAYDFLGKWCQERMGQVIACEGVGSTWLPFRPVAAQKTTGRMSHETVWLNESTSTVQTNLQF